MKTLFTFIFLFYGVFTLSAQDDLGQNNPNLQAQKGSYEIILDPTKGNHIVEMTSEILIEIEENRQETTYAYLNIAPSIIVKIYPRQLISSNTINSIKDEK